MNLRSLTEFCFRAAPICFRYWAAGWSGFHPTLLTHRPSPNPENAQTTYTQQTTQKIKKSTLYGGPTIFRVNVFCSFGKTVKGKILKEVQNKKNKKKSLRVEWPQAPAQYGCPAISPLRFWLAQYQAKPLARYDSYFYIFYFYFLQKYIFVFEIYRNIPGRPAPGRQGLLCKNFCENICAQVPGAGRPAAGRPALAARLQGDRLSHPYIRVGWSPHPHLHH